MKREYHISEYYANEKLFKILEEDKIPYIDMDNRYFICDVYSDNERIDEILALLTKKPMVKVIFSEEEMESANWYTFEATRWDIETGRPDFTYQYSCPYETSTGTRYRHKKQINYCISKRTPKWKNNYNFCSINTGDFFDIYCSDLAKKMITNRDIVGIKFNPVVNVKGVSTENVSQLVYSHKLPVSTFEFIREYREDVCPSCGYIQYSFRDPGEDNMRILADKFPEGIDFFVAEFQVRTGWGAYPVIVSKKMYDLVAKEMKEKHVRFKPIG